MRPIRIRWPSFRPSLRRTLNVRFALLDLLAFGTVGLALYLMAYRTTSDMSEKSLQRTTEAVAGVVEMAAEITVRGNLGAIAQTAYSLILDAYDASRRGEISLEEARRLAFRRLGTLQVAETGYVYVLDDSATLVYHPDPALNGMWVGDQELTSRYLREREGYLEYIWQGKPGEAREEPKAAFLFPFEPWGWTICVTATRAEFDRLVEPAGFRDYLLPPAVGAAGSVLIAQIGGPAIARSQGAAGAEVSDAEAAAILSAVGEAEVGRLAYTWSASGKEPARQKVAYYKQLRRFGWVVASTAAASEITAPASRMGLILLLALLGTAVAAVALTAPLAASVARPLEALAARLEAGAGGDFSIRMPVVSDDEVGRLAGHFNRYMDGLELARDRLASVTEDRERLAAAVEQLAEHVLITDTTGTIVYVNPAFERVTGYAAAEVIGKNPRLLRSGRHDRAFYEEMWGTLLARKVWRGRLINRRKDGTELVEDATIAPIRGESGAVESYVAIKRDVTEELEREEHRRQSQKLEAVGTLAGGIAHDFNNILTAILGYAELAQENITPEGEAAEHIRQVVGAGRRARELVSRLLTFSRKSRREARPVDLGATVREVLKLLRATIPATVAMEQDVDEAAGWVLADPTEVQQLVMNLCTNAYQAIGDRPGSIRVTVRRPPEHAGRRLELIVEDNGEGMPAEVMARIFEPFYTTKEAGKGTGLGLAVVHGIVAEMGGEVRPESVPGEGTTMRVLLPACEAPSAKHAGEVGEPPAGRGEAVLLIDDEESVRSVGATMLRSLGYQVLTAGRARDALELLSSPGTTLALVISDQTMPEMTGMELVRELARARPGLPVILTTGRPDAALEAELLTLGARALLPKPFGKAELARAAREALDGSSPLAGRASRAAHPGAADPMT